MKKKLSLLCAAVLCFALLVGCSASSASDTTSALTINGVYGNAKNESYDASEWGTVNLSSSTDSWNQSDSETPAEITDEILNVGRKLIKRVSMSMESLNFDESTKLLEQTVTEFDGYVESSSVNSRSVYDSYAKRSASYTVRLPAERLDNFLSAVGNIGNLTNQQLSTEDVTLSYVDTETRVRTLEVQLERLLALLENAETIDEIISLEDRISTVTYELEYHQSILNNYDNLVEYSTVEIYLREVERVTVIDDESTGSKILTGLKNTFADIADGFVNFLVWFIVNIPYIIIFAVIIGGVILIIVRCKRKKKAKRVHSPEPPADDK